jgi:hypothetical protein
MDPRLYWFVVFTAVVKIAATQNDLSQDCPQTYGEKHVFVNGTCKLVLSELSCDNPGEWLVLDNVTKTDYICKRRLCYNSYELKNGTCIPESAVNSMCGINQEPIMTLYGYMDCECVGIAAFWPADGNCYKLYSQGPCPAGKVFAFVPGRTNVTCLANICGETDIVYAMQDGYCYQIGK